MIISATVDRKAKDAQRLYAVCPFSLPGEVVQRLQGRAGDTTKTDFE